MRTHRRLLVSLCAVAVGLVLIAPSVGAEATTRVADSGWWWKAQTGALTPLPAPPGVEEGQLVVQSTPDGPQAVAAVSAVLADGHTNPVLTLDVASDAGGAAAVILACPAQAAWVGADAGRWDSRPPADCATSVTGLPSDDATQWTFALGPLVSEERVDVVLVPGRLGEAQAHPSFSLVFERPTAESIATTSGGMPAPDTVPPPTPPSQDAPAPGPVSEPERGGFDASAPTPPSLSAPAVPSPAEPATDGVSQEISAPAPVPPEAAAVSVTAEDSRTLARLIGAIVLVAGLAGVALSRTSFAGVAPEATADSPVLGGLGRFRSERLAEPQPVG